MTFAKGQLKIRSLIFIVCSYTSSISVTKQAFLLYLKMLYERKITSRLMLRYNSEVVKIMTQLKLIFKNYVNFLPWHKAEYQQSTLANVGYTTKDLNIRFQLIVFHFHAHKWNICTWQFANFIECFQYIFFFFLMRKSKPTKNHNELNL